MTFPRSRVTFPELVALLAALPSPTHSQHEGFAGQASVVLVEVPVTVVH
jgi:hypothetical protein